ncbi:hypothetical protein YC2023_092407 [Brassica napus]
MVSNSKQLARISVGTYDLMNMLKKRFTESNQIKRRSPNLRNTQKKVTEFSKN